MRIEVCQVWLFAILQMYEFSSKSQPRPKHLSYMFRCLRYCKCTSFQANHNYMPLHFLCGLAVCDTANVRVFKQITTTPWYVYVEVALFAILQMYEFSSKSQPSSHPAAALMAVCDTANVRVFKQITTRMLWHFIAMCCLRYCKCTSFQANHNNIRLRKFHHTAVCDTANVRVFKQITTTVVERRSDSWLFVILHNITTSTHFVPPRHQITLQPCPSNNGDLSFIAIKS